MNTRVILWAARITGTLLLAFLLFMLIGHLVGDANGPEGMRFTTTREVIAFAFFPCATMLGLVLAFKWELLGGLVAVGSMIALFLIMPGTLIIRFMVMLIPGLLYLVHGWMVRGTSAT